MSIYHSEAKSEESAAKHSVLVLIIGNFQCEHLKSDVNDKILKFMILEIS